MTKASEGGRGGAREGERSDQRVRSCLAAEQPSLPSFPPKRIPLVARLFLLQSARETDPPNHDRALNTTPRTSLDQSRPSRRRRPIEGERTRKFPAKMFPPKCATTLARSSRLLRCCGSLAPVVRASPVLSCIAPLPQHPRPHDRCPPPRTAHWWFSSVISSCGNHLVGVAAGVVVVGTRRSITSRRSLCWPARRYS